MSAILSDKDFFELIGNWFERLLYLISTWSLA